MLLDLVVCYCCALVGGFAALLVVVVFTLRFGWGCLGLLSRVVLVLVMQLLSGYVAIVLV